MGRWAQFPTHSGQRGATPNATAPAPATTAPLSTRTQSETARAQTPETTSISTAARCPVRRRRRRRRMSKLARRRRRRPVRRRLSKSAPLIRRISACLRTVLPANPTAGTLAGAAPRCPSRPGVLVGALSTVRSARTIFWPAGADTARAAATAVTYTSSASSTVRGSLPCACARVFSAIIRSGGIMSACWRYTRGHNYTNLHLERQKKRLLLLLRGPVPCRPRGTGMETSDRKRIGSTEGSYNVLLIIQARGHDTDEANTLSGHVGT